MGSKITKNTDSVQYRVGSLKDLNEKIIPHFYKYPLLHLRNEKQMLITQKQADFILLKKTKNNKPNEQ